MKVKAVIFDMDGVLIDSEPLWEKAFLLYLEILGKPQPGGRKYTEQVNRNFRGRNQQVIVANMRRLYGLKGSYDKIMADRLKILYQVFDQKLRLIPGAVRLLSKLYRRYPLALASSSPTQVIKYVVKRYNLKKYFRVNVSGDEVSRSKPSPDIFLAAAQKLKIKPEAILVIEDSISGVEAARRAGMKCIALKQPYTQMKYLASADRVVRKLSSITLKLIELL